MIPPEMEIDGSGDFLEGFFAPQSDCWLPGVVQMKNMVIGNNRQKSQMISLDVVPRLLQFMLDDTLCIELRHECAIVLGSLAKGTREDILALIDAGAISVLLKDINNPNLKYVEACLRCLKTIYVSDLAHVCAIYQDSAVVPHMISIIGLSVCSQECITSILSHCCKTLDHQVMLCSCGIITALAPFLLSDIYVVQMSTLRCLSVLCYQNEQVSMVIGCATYNDELLPNLIMRCLARDISSDMRMQAAKCLTYICRAGAISPNELIISHKTLPTLISLCTRDKTWEERVEAAETLAYLIEVDLTLQRMAAVSDHVIVMLADYFKFPGHPLIASLMPTKKDDIAVGNELRQAAFRAFASLGANDEDIRKKIIETESLMENVVAGLSDSVTRVQLAAVRCLHSLSRSVQQLRTSFQDHCVWKPLMKVLQGASDEVLVVASSTLCNLLLEFSPSKEPMLELGVIDLLVNLTRKDNAALRLNGIWALMNLAFQADQRVKSQILSSVGTHQLFHLLSDRDIGVLMKTLGLLRNLLSNKPHIDQMMLVHGREIMQAVILILEGDHHAEIKEQALCILGNVADGDTAKDFIMSNEDVLKKLMNYMVHSNTQLQFAATFCVSNLLWSEDEGALERQARLRELGVQKLLHQLLSTNDATLFDKVKVALQQF